MALTLVVRGEIIIILDEENIERIQQADPFELNTKKMGTTTLAIPLKIHICYARSDDAILKRLMESQDLEGVLKYLSRGFKVTSSDHDRKYDLYGKVKG